MLARPHVRSVSWPSLSRSKARPPSIDRLVDLVNADMERVNDHHPVAEGSEVTMIRGREPPDRFRRQAAAPMLTLAMAQLVGSPATARQARGAVEFMHTATLLHDDVVDESEMRRGRLAARMLWGNEASDLVGEFLLGQAFKMMVEVGSMRALDILSTARR